MRRLLPLLLTLLLLAGCSAPMVSEPPADYTAVQDGFRYTKQNLTPQAQYVYDQLLAGIKDQAEEIDDLYPDTELIQTAAQAIDRDYPELFWFSGTGRIETTLLGDKPLKAVYQPVYVMDVAQRQTTQAIVDRWTADCLAAIPAGATDYQKVAAIYTYVIDHADYDATLTRNSIVNVMAEGRGLCGCYAKTVQYLLGKVGMDAAYITGQADGQSHAWDLVWVEGNPVWVDPTWGDPTMDGEASSLGPSYEYLCISTADLTRTHTIDDKVPVPDCVTDQYNYFRQNGQYFEQYDPAALTQVFAKAMARGDTRVSIRFADGIYGQAKYNLLDGGELYGLLRSAAQSAGVPLTVGNTIYYTSNQRMGVLNLPVSS